MAFTDFSLEKYEKEIQHSGKLILLDFWNEDCAVCKNLSKVLEALVSEREDIKVFSVKAKDAEDLCQQYKIMTVPSLVFIKEGTVRKKTMGFKSKETLTSIIESVLQEAE